MRIRSIVRLGMMAGALCASSLVSTAPATANVPARPAPITAPAWQLSKAARPDLARSSSPDAKGFGIVQAFSGYPPFGRQLNGGVLVDKHGNIFGTTTYSPYSTSGYGPVFELQPSGSTYTETTVATFTGPNGASPYDRPFEDAAGNLYVSTYGGDGPSTTYGTLNKYTFTGSAWSQSAISFLGSSSNAGQNPVASPLEAGGTLYLPTVHGGGDGHGALLTLSPSDLSVSNVYSFLGPGSGEFEYPYSALVQGPGGQLYGTAEGGGTGFGSQGGGGGVYTGDGSIVFEFPSSDGVFTMGAAPIGSVVFDNSGNMYGTTVIGGLASTGCIHGCGVVFKLTNSGSGYTETVLHYFKAGTDGDNPYAGLVLKGKALYGTTYGGGIEAAPCGTIGCGTIFKIKTSGAGYKVIHRFQGTDGWNPYYGGLTLVGKTLYGTTQGGSTGATAGGVIFSWTI
jgi:uncharacterized repeat protein (TIGR03803 family)